MNDLILQVDFAKCYEYYQQDAIQSACFGNQCFSIFTACCYFSVDGKINESDVMHCKYYENLYVWSDGMGAQFRFRFFFWIVDGYRFAEQFAYVVLYLMPSWERSYRWYCMYTFFLFGLHVALQIIIKNSSQWIITQWSFNNFLQWIIKKYFKHFLVELIPILSF